MHVHADDKKSICHLHIGSIHNTNTLQCFDLDGTKIHERKRDCATEKKLVGEFPLANFHNLLSHCEGVVFCNLDSLQCAAYTTEETD